MEGKTVIITGGNRGIGKVTANEIAKKGARVILACRNLETALRAKQEICQETNNPNVLVKKLDLCSQKSIREFAASVIQTESRLDVLLLNAAAVFTEVKMTEDNLERTMATNHFGPFLLTHLLIDLLKQSAPSRILVASSLSYLLGTLNVNDINSTTTSWFPDRMYYNSKYANISFTCELARRLLGTGVTANCFHPGMIATEIWDNLPWYAQIVKNIFLITPLEGCKTGVYLACSEDVEGVSGKYFESCKERTVWRGASNPNKAKKLWAISEKLVNLREDDPKL